MAFTKKGLWEAIDSQEMSVFYKVHNVPVNSFKLINIFNIEELQKATPQSTTTHTHTEKEPKVF